MNFLKFGLLFLVMLRLSLSMRRLSSGKFEPFSWQDQSFAVKFSRSKRKVTELCLRIAIQDKLRFLLRRETRFDRVAKSLGIATEWQTGDARFDEKVFVLSEDVTLNRALTRDREFRDVCTGLIQSRESAQLECRQGNLYLGFEVEGLEDDSPSGVGPKFSQDLAALVKLRTCLHRIHAEMWREERDPALTRKAWLVGISVALGVAGLVGFFFDIPVNQHQVVREVIPRLATWITVGVVGMMLFATFAWLRSTPHTHAVLLDILLAAAPGCWAAANGGLTLYNEKLDRRLGFRLQARMREPDRRRKVARPGLAPQNAMLAVSFGFTTTGLPASVRPLSRTV